MIQPLSRRQLLRRGAGAAAGVALTTPFLRRVRANGPITDNVGIGLIGCGYRGRQLLEQTLQIRNASVVAVCDVDSTRAASAAGMAEKAGSPRPSQEGDFRRLLDMPEVMAVLIATPDHWHVNQFLHACQAARDVYLEAPASYAPIEGSYMVTATRRQRRVVQAGLQLRAAPWFEQAVSAIQEGRLGRISQTRSWTFIKGKPIRPAPDAEPPEHLDYDAWVGPAPMKPYNPVRVEYPYLFWDYGGGYVTRLHVHYIDLVLRAMRVNSPLSATAAGGRFALRDARETPDTLEASVGYETMHRPLAGRFMHVCSVRAGNPDAAWGPPPAPLNARTTRDEPCTCGVQFHGQNGTLYLDHRGMSIFGQGVKEPEIAISHREPAPEQDNGRLTREHLQDFVNCVITRAEPRAPIEAGVMASLSAQTINLAYRSGAHLYHNAANGQWYTDPDLQTPAAKTNELMKRTYRRPYNPPPI
jgi:predicted dehydrogenase